MKKKKMKKFTQAMDDADDKKHGIKEGSKADLKKDLSRGLMYHAKAKKALSKKSFKNPSSY